ncbi:MAG: exodeoxyribonuclease V subunit gamma [Actinomycetota bacterium]|nr:exodeoxyribonuclease V subunit gamma [Actinomycetota bacterium]
MSAGHHRVVTGALSALEAALADHVFAAKADDSLKPVVILVGGTLLRPYLGRRIFELRGPHINVRIVTASELGLRLGERAMISAGRTPLPLLADRVLAHEAALDTPGYFDAVRDTPGFGQALHRTLVELRRAGLSPDELAAAAPQLPESEKISALAGLARRHAELRDDHYDADDALFAADPTWLGADELIVYGVWDAPELVRSAIAAIAEDHAVTAYLPTAHSVANTAHADLRGWMASALGAREEALSGPASGAPALGHLQSSLDTRPGDPAPIPDDDTVRIVSAPDPSREVRAALRTCLRWAREGIPFHEMAIAYRHPEPYRPLVAALAREAGLPVYDHEGTPLAELPLGRRTLALLDLLEGDLDRASLIAFATDNRPPDAIRERYPGSPAQWDKASREAGIVRGRAQWRERLAAHRDRTERRFAGDDDREAPAWLPERLAQIDGLAGFVEELAERIENRPQNGSWSEHLAHLEETFTTYLRDHEPILESVRSLARLDRLSPTVSVERFGAVVRGVIEGLRSEEATSSRPGAFRARGINVLDVNSLRHVRFRGVCLLGLAERSFPPPPRQDPLLLDDERIQLGLPLRARGADPEPLQFALAVQAPSERLMLSHPRTEHGSGRPQLPSSFIRAAAEALAGERISAEQLADRTEPWLERLDADRLGAASLDQALDIGEYDRTLLEKHPELGVALMGERLPRAARGREAWLSRLGEGVLTPFEGGLTDAVRGELARHPRLTRPMSPSALETFATCPMQFFLSNVLGLRELEEPEEIPQITPLERGGLMHRVLERSMRVWLPDDPPSGARRATHLAELETIAGEECDAVERHGLTGYPALWAAERQGILLDLRLWYDAEVADATATRFDAADFEVGFGLKARDDDGPSSSTDPLELDLNGSPLRFHGRIDRLQWLENGRDFRVVDYKTGKKRGKVKDVFAGGKALQLPIYLLAAADVLLARDERRGQAEYFYSTRKGGFARVAMTGDTLAEHREEFEQIMGGFADAIAHGSFPARPAKYTCMWCDFRSICPSVDDHKAQMDRKASDPRVQLLNDLGEIE